MKYLKLYEDVGYSGEIAGIRIIKKYFIDDMSMNPYTPCYYLFQLNTQVDNEMDVTKLFTYSFGSDKILPIKSEYYSLEFKDFKILYEGNNFDDVYNNLLILIDSRKYNL